MSAVEITGLDHIYISVSDFARSEAFYDAVMRALGFKKGVRPIAGAPHVHYFNRHLQYTIRPALRGDHCDPYHPGVHHICFQTPDRSGVDEAYRSIRAAGVAVEAPAEYPEYNDDYYAIFFEDPDGVRLEVIAQSRYRRQIIDRWDDLTVFVNPIAELNEPP